MRAFRKLELADAIFVELREWSRMADDLTTDKNRLANRLREQLWRYYPQMLELEADITAEWMLDLWEALPTPAKAARVRESTVKKILKDHRIRRIDAAQVLGILRKPAIVVAPVTTEAATAHIRTLIACLRVVIEQLKGAHRQLQILCARLAEPVEKTDERPTRGKSLRCHREGGAIGSAL